MRAVMTRTVPGTSSAGRARFSRGGHVTHLTVKTGLKPGQQARLGGGQIHTGYANL
jgi:hypothetical protein